MDTIESPATNPAETLLIRGVDIPVVTTSLPQKDLRFFVDNPRVYSILRADGGEPSQDDIERKLLEMEHVKALVQDIKRDGGLTDPVVVRSGTLEVLEGNSRLAAYRALAKIDPVRWATMKARLLPHDIDESLIFALLGQYHIKGKKDWAPFEQAGFLYRRSKAHDVGSSKLAQEIGLSTRKVEHLIAVYQFMLDHGEADTAKWSYYDEYLKSSKIKKARLTHAGFDDVVIEKIKSGEIAKAVDVRESLPVICSSPKALQKFAGGAYGFDDALDHAVEAGADSTPLKKIAKFRQWLAMPETETALGHTQDETRRKILFELGKLSSRVEGLTGKLSSKK
ncbi:ParB N-terminal domain-containing protein [Rhizobium laguerreae]|uniref:ParB N-terminal domain-containing protein n=1 Tax=Rhizobium TaxID=379 RepID=UPI001C90F82A|nr:MULTISPECIES: ParB N-terminal domain-containing protein [Rhizobium]MBY2941836.1 ParB N-terminal domain-containing protein [Rhizobium leguminosarum]MBY3360191.1 ParB N-terminal domain-containing protein [Rhizobium laguerreae]